MISQRIVSSKNPDTILRWLRDGRECTAIAALGLGRHWSRISIRGVRKPRRHLHLLVMTKNGKWVVAHSVETDKSVDIPQE